VQRLLWLTVAASALVWAGAFLDFGGAHDRALRASSPTAAPSPEPDRSPSASSAPPATPGADLPRPRQDGVYAIDEQPGGSATGVSTPASVAASSLTPPAPSAADETPRARLGEGVSPEYAAIEQDYALETRDGKWALAEEQRLRAALASSAVGPQVLLVSCQDSVCRIVLYAASVEAFQQQLQAPGFSAATGLSASTPYSLHDGQLSLYVRKR
jgi:hypothetical protein